MPDRSLAPPPRRGLVRMALAAETTLAVVATLWIRGRDLPIAMPVTPDALVAGTMAAGLLAVINFLLVRSGPDVWPVRTIRQLYRELLEPLFGELRWYEAVAISVAAGVGEELFFRGAVQTEWGLLAASVLFGIVHIGGADMVAFGVWAAVVGAFLGWLAIATGGLVAPIVAHAVYDALALIHIRRSWNDREHESTRSGAEPEAHGR